MKIKALLAIALLFGLSAAAQQSQRLRIWLDPISEGRLQEAGFELDHGVVKKGVFLESDFTLAERDELEAMGIRFDVLVDSVNQFYSRRAATLAAQKGGRSLCGAPVSVPTPEGFNLGTMGGFITYESFLAELDSMHQAHPQLITLRDTIDTFTSVEGRPIFYVKISDNPSSDENEPEVLYTALHHAREPQSLAQLLFFMHYLLENYGTDAECTYLVNERELFFVPMLNPDGYVYNQSTDPNGGGLWRKNRRLNANGSYGVDLNRNYGYEWGYDNQGSSADPTEETYRGAAPFSEPETRAVKFFCEQHAFPLALNYHSFGNYLIYPWGFIPAPLTPDSVAFSALGAALTSGNGYFAGTGYETVGYATNGDSDDWMYGEQQSKPAILAMTPEVGNSGDGFWPIPSRIVPLAAENVGANLSAAHAAGDYLVVADAHPATIASLSGAVRVEVQRLGLAFNGPYTVAIAPVSANITQVEMAHSYTALAAFESAADSFTLELNAATPDGALVVYDFIASYNGYSDTTRVTKVFGQSTTAVANSGDSYTHWVGTWGVTTEAYYSSPASITDSPNATYSGGVNKTMHYQKVVDLRQSLGATLRFYAQWEIEEGYDYCQLQAAPVGTQNWTALCGRFTTSGTDFQPEGEPVWDGAQMAWVQEEIDLSDYIGQRLQLRFVFASDDFVSGDGFYFDDLEFNTILDPSSSIALDTGLITDSLNGVLTSTAAHFVLWPNPTSGALFLNADYSANVELWNATGALVWRGNLSPGQALDTESWPQGIYSARLSSGRQQHWQKVVLVRAN